MQETNSDAAPEREADKEKLEVMAGEMRDKDSQIEMLRNTVELLNQNIRALQEETKWRDQQMKLLRVRGPAFLAAVCGLNR